MVFVCHTFCYCYLSFFFLFVTLVFLHYFIFFSPFFISPPRFCSFHQNTLFVYFLCTTLYWELAFSYCLVTFPLGLSTWGKLNQFFGLGGWDLEFSTSEERIVHNSFQFPIAVFCCKKSLACCCSHDETALQCQCWIVIRANSVPPSGCEFWHNF